MSHVSGSGAPPSMAATQVRRAGLPRQHKVTLPGRRAAGVQRNQQGGVPGNLLPQLQQQEEQTHSQTHALGAKPGTSHHFLLNLLPGLMQVACPHIKQGSSLFNFR